MIFLDANAFYSYIGRRNLGLIESTHVNEAKLSKYLDSIREKSLPTSVFIEIMVHFRDDSSRLREILEFRLRKGLPLFNNIPDYCISEDEMTCIHFMDDFSLKKYAYKLLDEKIGVESRFVYLFYEITKNLYLEYRMQEIGGFTEKEGSTLWAIADKLRGAMNADDFRDYMLSFLFLRYLSDNYEEAIKKELGSDYQKCESELKRYNDNIDAYIQELKQIIVDYSNSLPLKKLGLNEDETNKNTIEKAKSRFVEDNNRMLYSKNIIPLTVWYIRNLDQVEILEKQMRRKIHYVIKPAYL